MSMARHDALPLLSEITFHQQSVNGLFATFRWHRTRKAGGGFRGDAFTRHASLKIEVYVEHPTNLVVELLNNFYSC